MPETEVYFFKDEDGSVPLRDWLDSIPDAQKGLKLKCITLIDQLLQRGHEIRRPTGDYLRDGVYELRTQYKNVQYRILYFFSGSGIAILSHHCTKKKKTPPKQIDLAVDRKALVDAEAEKYLSGLDD